MPSTPHGNGRAHRGKAQGVHLFPFNSLAKTASCDAHQCDNLRARVLPPLHANATLCTLVTQTLFTDNSSTYVGGGEREAPRPPPSRCRQRHHTRRTRPPPPSRPPSGTGRQRQWQRKPLCGEPSGRHIARAAPADIARQPAHCTRASPRECAKLWLGTTSSTMRVWTATLSCSSSLQGIQVQVTL